MKNTLVKEREFDTCNSHYKIGSDGILRIRKREGDPNIARIQQNVDDVKAELKGEKFLTILNNTGMPYAGKNARLIMLNELPLICKALALVSHDQASSDYAKLFVAISKMPIPVQIFRNDSDAENWLKSLNL